MVEVYDVCVVGAGIFGSSAARHLAESRPAIKVALVGPSEFKDKTTSDILGAHYDEGRITRYLDMELARGVLIHRSVCQFRDLEAKTGINFFTEIGCLCASNDKGYIDNITSTAVGLGGAPESLDKVGLKKKIPYMELSDAGAGRFLSNKAGHISPRKFVTAQKKAAAMAGCDVIDDIVSSVKPDTENGNLILTNRGQHLKARKLLIATGAFTGSRNLLPYSLQPKLSLRTATVILVEVKEPFLSRMKNMPPVSIRDKIHGQDGIHLKVYILPPIKYDDGKYYLKIGHGEDISNYVCTKEEIYNWYAYGSDPAVQQYLMNAVKCYFPGLPLSHYKWDRCVITITESGYPYVDMVTPSVGIAIGGNGFGAMTGDEVGRMAARMILKGAWDHDLAAEKFKFIPQTPGVSSKL